MPGGCESIKAVYNRAPERFSPAKIMKLCELPKDRTNKKPPRFVRHGLGRGTIKFQIQS